MELFNHTMSKESHTIIVEGRRNGNGQRIRHEFKIGNKFKDLKRLGEGGYGIVVKATQIETGNNFAIKKITMNNERCNVEEYLLCSTLREIQILSKLNHPNVIKIHNSYRIGESLDEIYLVQDLMEMDLDRMLHMPDTNFSMEHVIYFTHSLLLGLNHIHSANVIHRDLKPKNILINSTPDVKICDFGMARVFDEGENGFEREKRKDALTQYVVTRYYRAPEVILLAKNYGKEIDMWSLACVVYEMLTKQILFEGRNYLHQVGIIVDCIGLPSDRFLDRMGSEDGVQFIKNRFSETMATFNLIALEKKLPRDVPSAFHDFFKKALVFDPKERISVEEALNSDLFKDIDYHDDDDFIHSQCTEKFFKKDEVDMSFENDKLIGMLLECTEAL